MPDTVEDEPAFAATLGPEMTAKVQKVAKAMCAYSAHDEDGEPCGCAATGGGTCIAFGLYGYLAHVAVLAMEAWHWIPIDPDAPPEAE